jgi:PBP1b-binding outer membrane lipoprotein LpoB
MTMKNVAAIALAAILLSGCASITLPEVTAGKIEYHRTDPLGGTHITAIGVQVDREKGVVTAETVTWNTTYPAFSVQATITDYERKLTPAK